MKNFLLLTRVITKNNEMDMPDRGNKQKAYKVMGSIAMACIMIPCCIIVGFVVYVMTAALIEAGGMTEGLELIVQLLSVFGVVFSIMVIFNVLYFSSDLDHLLPLPLKPGELVAAKFTHAYLAESVMEFMILFVAFIGYFIAAGLHIVSFLTAAIGVFMLPVLPLVYCGIFSLIVMAFFNKVRILKNVDFMVGLVSVVFVGLFLVSFLKMDSISIENYIDSLMSGKNMFINIMGKIFFTVPLFLKALGSNSILYLLMFILANAVSIAILLLLGNKLYLKGVYLNSSSGKAGKGEKKHQQITYKKNDVSKAYFMKECRILYRTPAYRKYCVVVNFIWPLIVVALFVLPATKGFMDTLTKLFTKGYVATDIIALLIVIMLSFFATAMNSIASTSFTREGAHFSFIKHVPLEYKLQIRLKAAVSILYSGITTIISVIILCIFMKCSLLTSIYFAIIGMLSVIICTYIGIMLDSAHPKLNWEDEYGALRGNLNAFFNMAIAIVIAFVLCLLGFILFRYTSLDRDMIYIVFLAVFIPVSWYIIRAATEYAVKSISNDL
jgi:ABC-2 type transport system permease protein